MLAAVAVPLHEAVGYVAAAYVVFVAIVLLYVAIMATKLGRIEREIADLGEELDARERVAEPAPEEREPAELTA